MVVTTVTAATIRVPLDQPTIQDGINVAISGDTVLVSDGTYKGVGNRNINFGGKAIVVRSENGATVTIVDVDSTLNRGFIFSSGEDTLSVLDGFTITRAIADTGAGILIYGGSPKVLNCLFEKMWVAHFAYDGYSLLEHSPMGQGLAIIGNSHPVIRGCVFSKLLQWYSNGSYFWGGGMAVDFPASVLAEDCSFEDIQNRWLNGGLGVALYDGGAGSQYRRCRFLRNGGSMIHGAAYSVPVFLLSSESRFDSCLFAWNLLDGDTWGGGTGAGAIWLRNSSATITNCTFFGSTVSGWDWPLYDSAQEQRTSLRNSHRCSYPIALSRLPE
jgi:hypothetical protein